MGKSSMNEVFPIAAFDYQRVISRDSERCFSLEAWCHLERTGQHHISTWTLDNLDWFSVCTYTFRII